MRNDFAVVKVPLSAHNDIAGVVELLIYRLCPPFLLSIHSKSVGLLIVQVVAEVVFVTFVVLIE